MMFRNVLAILVLVLVGTTAADIGIVDTVGGTIYEWQYEGPALRRVVNSPAYGVHVTWMWSNDTVGCIADRNFRYNFYDFATRRWVFNGVPPFMLWGTNVFQQRSGFGSIDADPLTGCAVISCHQGSEPIHPCVARDVAPGAGTFEYCNGSPVLDGYMWPASAVGHNQTVHLHCIDDASRQSVWYSRTASWCNWDAPMSAASYPPCFPDNNIAASKVSDKVCLAWVQAEAFPCRLLYRVSTNGGDDWEPEVDLGYPPAYGPDTGCSYYITSASPFYDREDRLHFIVDVMPIIRDTGWLWPNELWHWCADNVTAWSRVHRADADPHGQYNPGADAMLADGPSLGEDSRGNMLAAWEQFDTLNVEPLTDLMRADIWVAGSSDDGNRWQPAVRITEPNTQSKRLPSIIDLAIDGGSDPDSVIVVYLADSVAGARAGSAPVGPWSFNPVIAHKIPVDLILSGMAEPRDGTVTSLTVPERLSVAGSLARGSVRIHYSLPTAGHVRLQVFDAAGRRVAGLAAGRRAAGRHTVDWNAAAASPGVYYCTLRSERSLLTEKIILAR
jgi:hypothetical protein